MVGKPVGKPGNHLTWVSVISWGIREESVRRTYLSLYPSSIDAPVLGQRSHHLVPELHEGRFMKDLGEEVSQVVL